MSIDLTHPMFHDEDRARAYFEAQRWPDGPYCPHCGNSDQDRIALVEITRKPRKAPKDGKHRPSRAGLYNCNECREQFTVTVGSVMERSKIPLTKWAAAFHLMCASKKGVSAHQLMRMLGIGSYRTAWFLAHRVREAMKDETPKTPLGGSGKVVEADELYVGKRENPLPPSPQRKGRPYIKRGKSGPGSKRVVIGLVERGGHTRLFHIQHATRESVRDIVVRNVSR